MKASIEVLPKGSVALTEAVAAVSAQPKAKFDESVDIAIKLGVDPRHADQMVRGSNSLPNGTGKTAHVAVFAKGPKAEEATAAGADIVVNDSGAGRLSDIFVSTVSIDAICPLLLSVVFNPITRSTTAIAGTR